jgi:hypothetical protein
MIVCEILARPLRDPSKKDDDRTLPKQHENRATVAAIDMRGYVSFAVNTNNYVRFTAEDFARPRSSTNFLLIPREHDPRASDRTG